MLFYLAEPAALLGIVLALLIGIYVHDGAQVVAARLLRDPSPLRSGRLTASLKHRVSPFSAVAMLIAGVGWTEPIPMNDVWRKRRFHVAAAVLAGPLAYLLLAFVSIVGFKFVSEPLLLVEGDRILKVAGAGGFPARLLLWMAGTFGSLFILSLIPVPPADGGRVLFLLGPQTPSWHRAHYQLRENNVGIVILLVILLLPVLFVSFPSVVGQLILPLLRGLGRIVNIDVALG
ncbi:Zn-dependent membrane protease [Candidatus Protofrankia californiensis]|uniref:Zn-dependent membrane protease n=1 Tax=Candidatus Protofrankia californiensis TaxID=1839754 RepID=UPI0010413E14|nr:Zn-dependent membrane protease [Candidatus Protofrankia californiensis]